MGNCLVVQDKVVMNIKVMKPDGEILEYKPPIKVHQLLSEYSGHTISDTLPVVRPLRPDADMLAGNLYHLLPLPAGFDNKKRMVQSSYPRIKAGEESDVVRIKMVISKKELEMMMRKGAVPVGDLVAQLQKKQSIDVEGNCRGWKPLLESIPEVN